MGDNRMTATRRDERDHESRSTGSIFQDSHMGTSNTAMRWMVRNLGESLQNIVGTIEDIFSLHKLISEPRINELMNRCKILEELTENYRDDMEELEEKTEIMRNKMEELEEKTEIMQKKLERKKKTKKKTYKINSEL